MVKKNVKIITSTLVLIYLFFIPLVNKVESRNFGKENSLRYSFIIGVDYSNNSQLNGRFSEIFSINDSKEISKALKKKCGFRSENQILLNSESSTTRSSILREFSRFLSTLPPKAIVFIYFSGHGFEHNGSQYVCASDTLVSSDSDLFSQSAIDINFFKLRLFDKAKRDKIKFFLFVDACREELELSKNDSEFTSEDNRDLGCPSPSPDDSPGTLDEQPIEEGSPSDDQDINKLPNPDSIIEKYDNQTDNLIINYIVNSCESGKQAFSNEKRKLSYMTWALILGINGAAFTENNEVELNKLLSYARDKVSLTSCYEKKKIQSIVYSIIDGSPVKFIFSKISSTKLQDDLKKVRSTNNNSPIVPIQTFSFHYPFPPTPGQRTWEQLSDSLWVERYEDGRKTYFRKIGGETINGCQGTVVQNEFEKTFEVFIPELKCEVQWLRFRQSNGQWNWLGEIHRNQ